MKGQFILGQYVRIIGCPERLTVGAIGDGSLLLFGMCGPYLVPGGWWPVWLVEAA